MALQITMEKSILQYRDILFVALSFLFYSQASANQIEIRPFTKPELNFESLFNQKATTDFSAFSAATRSVSATRGASKMFISKFCLQP